MTLSISLAFRKYADLQDIVCSAAQTTTTLPSPYLSYSVRPMSTLISGQLAFKPLSHATLRRLPPTLPMCDTLAHRLRKRAETNKSRMYDESNR